jgi:hypothetical protein
MAGTYATTLSSVDVNKIWRKVQGKLQTGLQYVCEEYQMLDDLQKFDINVSAREITVPLDIDEGAGVASINEGDYEAMPFTPNVEEITLTWINLSKRFTASLTAMYLDQYNQEAQIKRQLKHQGAHAVRDIARDWSDRFYGVSLGYIAQTPTVFTAATATFTLTNGYGDSSITDTTFISDKLRVNDRIALIRAGAIVTNSVGGLVTSITTAGVVVAVFSGTVTSVANDFIVKANSQEQTTIAGTDYNKGMVGLLDVLKTASIHSLSSATVPNWQPALTDTTGGRFSGVRLTKMINKIGNLGGGTVDRLLVSQGVDRDLFSSQSAALRFQSPFGMELLGSAQAKGLKKMATRRVPPGYAIAFASESYQRFNLVAKPTGDAAFAWKDGDKLQDKNAMAFSLDFPVALVCTARRNFAYMSGLTES